MGDELRIEELTSTTIAAVNALTLKPGQEQFVAPVSYAAAAAVVDPSRAWQRVVLRGDTVVGFVHGHFEPDVDTAFRSILWRINVDAEGQGQGVGTFAVAALADEARARGFDLLNVIYEAGEAGPAAFFTGAGFVPTDETEFGEVVATMPLS